MTALALWMLLESDLWETDIFWVVTPGAGRVHQGLVVVQQNAKGFVMLTPVHRTAWPLPSPQCQLCSAGLALGSCNPSRVLQHLSKHGRLQGTFAGKMFSHGCSGQRH